MADTRTQIQARYDAKNRITISIKLNKKYDSEIIEKLEQVESMQGYIKQLIRDDISRTCSDSSVKKYVSGKQDLPSDSDKVKCMIDIAVNAGIEKELLSELKKLDSASEMFKDPYADKIAMAVSSWIDKSTSVLSDERPYVVSDSAPKNESEE